MTLVSADAMTVHLGGKTILKGVTFSLSAGEIVTIVGPNGSGKTTFLRALLGSVPISRGQITRKDGLRIGYVPQALQIDGTLPLTAERFLNLPNRYSSQAQQAALRSAGAMGLENRQMSQLSGGQFQRVLLARALLSAPDILVLDEPTKGLDHPASAAFYQTIASLRQETGCSILMVSHELHVVMSASDRVICLNGHICCEGAPELVATAPAYRALFGTGTGGALALYRHEHSHSHDDHDPIHKAQ